jgi:hypothetical protein
LLKQIPFVMSGRKLVRNSELLSVKTTLDIITEGTTKVDGIEDFVVNVDQALTSDLILLRLLETTKLWPMILSMYPLLTEALMEEDIATALDQTTLLTIILTGMAT